MRISLVVITGASLAIIFLHTGLDEKTRNCLVSHELRANSFYCLNKKSLTEEDSSEHSGTLHSLGFIAALLSSAVMLGLSHKIFVSFTSYLDRLIEEKSNQRRDHTLDPFERAPIKQLQIQT